MPVDFGFRSYGIREIARQNRDTTEITNEIISVRLLLSFSITGLIIFLMHLNELHFFF